MNETLTPLDIADAEDALLRDVDTLQDWISGECLRKPDQPWLPQVRTLDATAWSVPGLLAIAFDSGQKPGTRISALNELAVRYIKTKNTEVLKRASEAANARIADEVAA